ncbi:recombinase family protein [Aurantimonas sp. MSK8Z-1]|uniref:recombinase family protein n=1 Tax=Mangrovibrevibacter kandeliae TaxID=2968473 RepID=UPI002117B010|nr:recombinase family protein [Aurantimonas sp. MSK8Z-1]MCW4117060.1 recombinase family protein [Aurantimonas sp. MSK8Z-1]
MTIAYSYLRFSTPEQAKGDSTRRQIELAERYAAEHGLTLDANLRMTDEGVSAFRAKNVRAGALGRFLRAIDDGIVEPGSFLLVENLDRVSRASPWDAMPIFQQIINAGITIVTLQDGRAWSVAELRENPFRIFESLMVMIRANQESETKSRRLKAVWEAKRRTAGSVALTARAPAWLRLDRNVSAFVVDDEKAAVINRIFELTEAGWGQNRITELLNTEGVSCFGGAKHWHRSYVAKLLENPAVIGTLVPHEVHYEDGVRRRKPLEPVAGYYPAIVSEELFQRVRAQRMGKRAPAVRKGMVANLFGGLARCPVCDASMTRVSKGSTSKGGKPYLVCRAAKAGAGCRYRATKLPEVEEALFQNAGWLMSTAPSGDDTVDDRLASVEDQVSALEREVTTLVSELASRPSPAIRTRLTEQEAVLEALHEEERKLLDLHAATSGPFLKRRQDDLLNALEATPPDPVVVNGLMRQVFSKVVVDYRKGQLAFNWRQGGTTSVTFAWPEDPASAQTAR